MPKDKDKRSGFSNLVGTRSDSNILNPARIYAVPHESRCLDPTQLAKLEQSFRSWADASPRADTRTSRRRILLIFLLIRYTGARLNEVLTLDLRKHIDVSKRVVHYGNVKEADNRPHREVQISSELMSEIQMALNDSAFGEEVGSLLRVDQGHVRRKFYERSVACGFAQDLGSPNAIRRARAVELMRSNMPLPVVQRVLGHSTPNLTASLVTFSDEDIHQVTRHFIERESRRKTSARNTFFGKIGNVRRGDIQSRVELVTVGGDVVTTVITNNSLKGLGLKVGSLVIAEVKAPWVILQKAHVEPLCTAENMFHGTVTQILRGKITTEFIVRIQDGTQLCSLVTEESRRKLDINEGDKVWVMFNSFAVILHVD
ncbi:MAG: TOBE domain-containing protein [Desulfomonile tiedjei]|nr:TOBE domain-containing protein [Desulfomonile tiedjei]